eukprot:CAMPEP_0181399432 /NCGR_PEP_ID=MMETSP1110-20121109/1591_1 /TAXON_ID=174948 /ORGANISM="Symbiodinium sp., Strain CCMP421" /LENGTH=158 /DNA_ID=CAMNT_0023521489 /DNA_START=378 /DNA_END=855 /DNA_ORIENTATION=-
MWRFNQPSKIPGGGQEEDCCGGNPERAVKVWSCTELLCSGAIWCWIWHDQLQTAHDIISAHIEKALRHHQKPRGEASDAALRRASGGRAAAAALMFPDGASVSETKSLDPEAKISSKSWAREDARGSWSSKSAAEGLYVKTSAVSMALEPTSSLGRSH